MIEIITEEEILKEFQNKESHSWGLTYIQDGEIKVTFYRSRTIEEAVHWLDEITGHQVQIIGAWI